MCDFLIIAILSRVFSVDGYIETVSERERERQTDRQTDEKEEEEEEAIYAMQL